MILRPRPLLAVGLIAIVLTACGGAPAPAAVPSPTSIPTLGYPAVNIPSTQPAGSSPTSYPAPIDQSPTEQGTLPPTTGYPAPATPVAATQPPIAPASGVVVFDRSAGQFHVFGLDGKSKNQDFPAQGLDFPGPKDFQLVGQNIYYYSSKDQVIYKTGVQGGPQPLEFTRASGVPTGFAVSTDESQIAWSKDTLQASPPSSELWVAGVDGSNARMAARNESQSGSLGFLVMRPVRWTADGKLLYEQQPIGLGGYIIFAGLNSLYEYDPTANTSRAILPAGPKPNLCLETLFPGDASRGVFSCAADEKSAITFRSLPDGGLLKSVPPVEDQGKVGTAVFSPDGSRLAYAVARNDPNQEHGQVVVTPTDLSSAPKSIASVEPGYFTVLSWASPTQILFQKYEADQTSVWVVNADGTGAAQIASGQYVGMIR